MKETEKNEIDTIERRELPRSPALALILLQFKPPQAACTGKEELSQNAHKRWSKFALDTHTHHTSFRTH